MTQTTLSPSQVARSPYEFARRLLKIMDKHDLIVPLIYNPVQLRYLANRTPRDLILKPRQKGISTAIQAEHYRYSITRPTRSLTLMDVAKNTENMRAMAKRFHDNFPEVIDLEDGRRLYRTRRNEDNATTTTYENGSRAVMGTAGSFDVGRSGSYRKMHGSEVGFWADAGYIIRGAMQAGSPDWVALESTANGSQGWYYEQVMQALDGDSTWKLHFFRWFDDLEYSTPLSPDETLDYTGDELALIEKHSLSPAQIKWRRAKIKEIGTLADFLAEYPEDVHTSFKHSGIGYFGNVDHALKAPPQPTYDPAHRYVAGLDFGQQQDYTVLMIIDATKNHMVHMVRIRHEKWAEMRKAVLNACKAWDVRIMHAEKNSMGSSEIESLYTEFTAAGLRTDIIPFNMTAVNKPSLMAHYRSALHEGGLLLQDLPVIRHELDSAVSKQTLRGWTVESPRDGDSGHGDTVVAGALANYSIGFI